MKVKKEVLKQINTKQNRLKIACSLCVCEATIVSAIALNGDNSSLTKLGAIIEIAKIIGVSGDEKFSNVVSKIFE